MRTTVTLDTDVEALVRGLMDSRGVSFKQALNDAIRSGSRSRPATTSTVTHAMGQPSVGLDRALQLAGELEDEELLRRVRTRQ